MLLPSPSCYSSPETVFLSYITKEKMLLYCFLSIPYHLDILLDYSKGYAVIERAEQ